MNIKWIQFLVPVILSIIATPVFAQTTQISNTFAGNEKVTNRVWPVSVDIMASAVPDSLTMTSTNNLTKDPGKMPMIIPGLLPNSMPILNTPPIDEKMIVPVNLNQADADTATTSVNNNP